ncbi:hypothetical protein [Rhodococcus sp. NPDC058521]|uniref:hypothetical protein n=1 Tax=Rhodococcus sp. NPDC058521 TaxID=3346536 RepID=UPI003646D2B9
MSKGRGKGNLWLAGTLGRIAFATSCTYTFLDTRYRCLERRCGKQKAIVAKATRRSPSSSTCSRTQTSSSAISGPDTTLPGILACPLTIQFWVDLAIAFAGIGAHLA